MVPMEWMIFLVWSLMNRRIVKNMYVRERSKTAAGNSTPGGTGLPRGYPSIPDKDSDDINCTYVDTRARLT